MSYHSEDSDYTNLLEQRADWLQYCEDSRRRYEEANPLWDKCFTHPDRQREEGGHYCAECRENHRRNYTDKMIERDLNWNDPARWGPEYDSPHHSDPRITREEK